MSSFTIYFRFGGQLNIELKFFPVGTLVVFLFYANANDVLQLQCNDFNRGLPRLFNQSEADSLTKNFDFVVLKANQICS